MGMDALFVHYEGSAMRFLKDMLINIGLSICICWLLLSVWIAVAFIMR
jgi:hypothetical protein